MSSRKAAEIIVPHVKIGFDDLLAAIRQLDEAGRAKIARVLLETRMDDEMRSLLKELSEAPPQDDISDAEIEAEVSAVHESRAGRQDPRHRCRRPVGRA